MEKDITRHTGSNMGGLYSFKFIPYKDIESIPESFNGAIHHAVVLKSNARWFDGYCTEFTMQFTEKQQDSDQGAFFNKLFVGNVPKDRADLVEIFEGIKNERFLLDIIDNNGSRKLVGTLEEPLSFSSDFDSKNDTAGRNEFKISFGGPGVKKSPLYLNM